MRPANPDRTRTRSRSRSRAINVFQKTAITGGTPGIGRMQPLSTGMAQEHREAHRQITPETSIFHNSSAINSSENGHRRSRSRTRTRLPCYAVAGGLTKSSEESTGCSTAKDFLGDKGLSEKGPSGGGGPRRVIPASPVPSFYSVPRLLPVKNSSTQAPGSLYYLTPSTSTQPTARKRNSDSLNPTQESCAKTSRHDEPSTKSSNCGATSSHSSKPIAKFFLSREPSLLPEVEIIAVKSGKNDDDVAVPVILSSASLCVSQGTENGCASSPRAFSFDNRPARRIPVAVTDRRQKSLSDKPSDIKQTSAHTSSKDVPQHPNVSDDTQRFVDALLNSEIVPLSPLTSSVSNDEENIYMPNLSFKDDDIAVPNSGSTAAGSTTFVPDNSTLEKQTPPDYSEDSDAGILGSEICTQDDTTSEIEGVFFGNTKGFGSFSNEVVQSNACEYPINSSCVENNVKGSGAPSSLEPSVHPTTSSSVDAVVQKAHCEDVEFGENGNEDFHDAHEDIQDEIQDEKKTEKASKGKKRSWCTIA